MCYIFINFVSQKLEVLLFFVFIGEHRQTFSNLPKSSKLGNGRARRRAQKHCLRKVNLNNIKKQLEKNIKKVKSGVLGKKVLDTST